jgi:hypothetical protein
LNALIASGATHPEIFLLNNDTKPPYSNQWNVGFRQTFGTWLASAAYSNIRGYHGFTWVSATGTCCSALAPGFGNVIISDPNGKRFWYDGESISLDRPYTDQTKWGVHFVYTHSKASQTGNDLFSLDAPSASAYAKHPPAGTEPNHIVATGIVGVPWDVRLSTTATFGTGPATPVFDFSQGFDLAGRAATGVLPRAVYPGKACTNNCPSGKTFGFGYRDIDLRASKAFSVGGRANVELIGELFNAFNWTNYGCLNNFLGPGDSGTAIGLPNCVVSLGRREQVGLRLNF